MTLLIMAGLAYLVSSLTPESINARRVQQNQEVLTQAREALIGYAIQYREQQTAQGQPDRVYGYLPLPDLGTTRNNNAGCVTEGCDAANFAGNALNSTVIGRLPWRTLGLEPLRDGHGECLWYAVSGSHQRELRVSPMNWDTLSHLDVVVANGTAALASALAGAHERPVAVIFSPGPPLPGQNRIPPPLPPPAGDDVARCGGNYDVANYLDPATAAALGGVTNYLAGTNKASAVTDSTTPKALSLQGKVFDSGGNFLPNACQGSNCDLVASDIGLAMTGDALFAAIRKSAYFRTDINAMLDRMTFCLRDQVVAGGFTPDAIGGFTPPADKSAGRTPSNACYDDSQNPLGYFSHYSEMLFLAKPNAGNFTVNGDPNCAGVLLFPGQRSAAQQRATTAQKNTPSSYLESSNLASFTAPGTTFGSVGGPSLFDRAPPQAPEQDIARCIPVGASFTLVTSPTLTAQGFGQIVAYDAATRTLTLGKQDVTTGNGAGADALFGCAWVSEVKTLGSGVRAYYRFQFRKVGTSVGGNGFVFAIADALKNSFLSCGAGGSHLAYSGNNGTTPIIDFPKIGIEFDQSRNTGFSELASLSLGNPGRNDPCGTACSGAFNSHAAIVYWGHEVAGADGVTLPNDDDNVHGFPTVPPGPHPPPRSHADPAAESGIKFVNLRGDPDDSKLYHVRIEVTPTRTVNADAMLSNTSMRTEVWLESNALLTNQIAALKNTTRPMSLLYPTYATTLSDTAILYDVEVGSSSCTFGVVPDTCPAGQACGSSNTCYRPALQTVQLGFTGSQRTSDQEVTINDFFTTWLP